MKRYRFSLESALRARRAQEEVARQRLAEANQRLRQARAAHQLALEAYRAETGRPNFGDGLGLGDIFDFAAGRAHELRMAEAVERAQWVAEEQEVAAATCFAAWVEAGKQVASLERLDERRRAEWQSDLRRDEAAAVDDVVAARWAMTGGGA